MATKLSAFASVRLETASSLAFLDDWICGARIVAIKPVPTIPIFTLVTVMPSVASGDLFEGVDLDVGDRSGGQLPVEGADGFAGHVLFPYLAGGPFLDEDVDALFG
ncbi:hypothetical protein LOF22_18555 [Sinorhizobium meliloti]|nr:hypothetical protein [Sinorhizobium meliloti]MDE4547114.1 hypothetical protein [Sinorhizobium meliloti]MDE4570753.1 hypothetical protein [Sinorhizobium meliloti]